jgi:hypothetical protein
MNILLLFYLNYLLKNTGGYIGATLTDDQVFSFTGSFIFISIFLLILLIVNILKNIKTSGTLVCLSNLFFFWSGIMWLFYYFILDKFLFQDLFQGPIQIITIFLILSTILYIANLLKSSHFDNESTVPTVQIDNRLKIKKRYFWGFIVVLIVTVTTFFLLDYCYECSGIPTLQILDYLPIIQIIWFFIVLAIPSKKH